jgi:CheY-like chemotaxis protein
VKRQNQKKSKDPEMKKTVLVVDDSPTIRKIVQLCLKEQQIEVLSAGGGAEAVEKLRKSMPDLMLADTVMPGPDGYQLCERLKGGEFGGACPWSCSPTSSSPSTARASPRPAPTVRSRSPSMRAPCSSWSPTSSASSRPRRCPSRRPSRS